MWREGVLPNRSGKTTILLLSKLTLTLFSISKLLQNGTAPAIFSAALGGVKSSVSHFARQRVA
jgi:hypothetical protein